MAIALGDNIGITGPLPTDNRYFSTSTNKPWANTGETNAALAGGVGGVRYTGLTVNIAGSEYWYKDGIEDVDLIEKTTGGGDGVGTFQQVTDSGCTTTNSVVIGDATSEATGTTSFAHGYGAKVHQDYGHAEGWGTLVCGYYAHAEGGSTRAEGWYSHAEGSSTKTCASYAHAEGCLAEACGQYSHAEGGSTIACGYYSHAEGGSTIACGYYSHASGIHNIGCTTTIAEIGVGSLGNRCNAFEVFCNGQIAMPQLTGKTSETCVVFIDVDGKLTTGVASTGGGGIGWSGSTANAIGTYVDADGICAEPNLTFDGTILEFAQGADRCICVAEASDGGNGDSLNITAGLGDTDTNPGIGGNLRLCGGGAGNNTSSTGVVGGYALVFGGEGGDSSGTNTAGAGGAAYLRAGQGGAGYDTGDGGDVYVCGGISPTGGAQRGNGGDVYICSGVGLSDGCVELFHNTTSRLRTTTTGVNVTGILCATTCVTTPIHCATSCVGITGNIRFSQGDIRCITVDNSASGVGDGLEIRAGKGITGSVSTLGGNMTMHGGESGQDNNSVGLIGGYVFAVGGTGGASSATNGGIGGRAILRGGTGGEALATGNGGQGGCVQICGGSGGPGGSGGNGGHVYICSSSCGTDGCVMLYHGTTKRLHTTTTGTYTTGTHCATTCVRTPLICVTGSGGVHLGMSVACGSAIDWIATSDCRIKKCVEPITSALSTVDALCGVCYELCEDDTKDMGLIAQAVEIVEPRLVTREDVPEEYKKYGIDDEILGLKYDKMAGLFVEAIKELKVQNECLQNQINELKNK